MKTIELICPQIIIAEEGNIPFNAKLTLAEVALNVYKDYKIYTEITPCIIYGYDIAAHSNNPTAYDYNALKLVTTMPNIVYDGIVRDLKRNFENADLQPMKNYADEIIVGAGNHYTIKNKFILFDRERINVCTETSMYVPGKKEYYSNN